jgi:hypothetical protein
MRQALGNLEVRLWTIRAIAFAILSRFTPSIFYDLSVVEEPREEFAGLF